MSSEYVFDTGISNWGRWGDDDQIGTLNHIDLAAMQRGFAAVKQGRQHSLAMPMRATKVPVWPDRTPSMHFMTLDGGDYAIGAKSPGGQQTMDSYLFTPTHGGTHIDALCHVLTDDKMYNGHPSTAIRSFGSRLCGIDQMPGILTRGVLLDVAALKGVDNLEQGYAITTADLEACLEKQAVQVESGDAVLIRTGWLNQLYEGVNPRLGEPGLGMDTIRWWYEREVSVIGSDNHGVEVAPAEEGDTPSPVHVELLRNQGLPLMELLDLNALAHEQIYEFLFLVAPLKIFGGAGSPVNPVALY